MAAKQPEARISIELPPIHAEDVVERVVEKLADHFRRDVEKRLDAMVQAVFDERVRDAADKAVGEFLQKRIPKTNTWGEKVGEGQTITEYIVANFEKYMQQRVQSDGRPADYDRGKPRHEWLIEQFGLKEIEKVAANEIAKVRKAAEAQISAAVGNFIAQNVVAPVTAKALTGH